MKSLNPVVVIALLFFLVTPVAYLIYKTSGLKSPPREQPAAAAATDIATLEATVKSNPTFANLINLSMALINNNMPGKSIDYLDRAIELNPKSAVAYNNKAVAYIMMQQYQNGIDACNKALQIDPTFQLAKNNLKWAMDEKNKVMLVIKQQENTPISNRNTTFYINYGLSYFKIGEYDKSIAIWNKILATDTKSADAYINIGTAFMMMKQYDKAIVAFNKAVSLQPDYQLAKNNLAWALEEKKLAN